MKTPPPLDNPLEAIEQLANDLRNPDGGCPWDLKQTHNSLINNVIEEAYEVADALADFDSSDAATVASLKEELGDLLFQVVLHAQLASEKNLFNLADVAKTITEKLIFRHPHVYGDANAANKNEVLQNWEKLKRKEREKKNSTQGMLSGLPRTLPALQSAYAMGKKVARINFDWPHTQAGREHILNKIDEEQKEFFEELSDDAEIFNPDSPHYNEEQKARASEELGDYLFAISQYARHFYLDPEESLRLSNNKFKKRFAKMEINFKDKLDSEQKISLEEWEAEWQKVKQEILRDDEKEKK